MTNKNDDEEIVVEMPRGDYNIMREMIKDRKTSTFVVNKVKSFSLYLSGVLASWFFLGDSLIQGLKKLVGVE